MIDWTAIDEAVRWAQRLGLVSFVCCLALLLGWCIALCMSLGGDDREDV